jgi:hypothetical protein
MKDLLVVDVDLYKGGVIPAWCTPTLEATTGSGGLHLFYRLDRAIGPLPDGCFGPGVDGKSSGGYVLLPGSRNLKGEYAWRTRRPIARLKADEVLTHLDPAFREGQGTRVKVDSSRQPETVEEGHRHAYVMSYVGGLVAGGLDGSDPGDEAALYGLAHAYNDRFPKPMDAERLEGYVQYVLNADRRNKERRS